MSIPLIDPRPAATIEGPALTLDRLPAGARARVVAVGQLHATELLREGLLPGADVAIRSTAPLGGPVIVEVGQATVAVARAIAAVITVAPDGGSGR
jgi:Fe2+ transport system protein FeoA